MGEGSATQGRPDGVTLVAFLAVAVFGGLNAIAVKASVRELEPFWSAGSRFVAAALILIVGTRDRLEPERRVREELTAALAELLAALRSSRAT